MDGGSISTSPRSPEMMENKLHWSLIGATRFFLAAIVAISHLTQYLRTSQEIERFAKFSGMAAVLGFLLISGYSIAHSYSREPKDFYFRRFVRIVPIYILAITSSVLISTYFGGTLVIARSEVQPASMESLIGNLLFLQGFLVQPINTNLIVWTLSVEVFFYVVTPWLSKIGSTGVLVLAGISASCFVIYRILHLPYYAELIYGVNVLFLAWPWLLGFWYFSNYSKPWALMAIYAIGVCAIGLNGKYLANLWELTWTLTCVVVGYTNIKAPVNAVVIKALNLAGETSYPLYLFHLPVYCLIYELNLPNNGILYFILAVLVSFLINFLIDKPLGRVLKAAYYRVRQTN